MAGRPVHRLKQLQAFLDAYRDEGTSAVMSFLIKAILVLMGLLFVGARSARFVLAGWVALFALGAVAVLLGFIESQNRRNRPFLSTSFDLGARTAIIELSQLNTEGQLEERMDPEVGDLLNACAARSLEISETLAKTEWSSSESHRKEAKAAASEANHALMGDALVIAMSAVRAKGARRDAFAKRMADPKVKDQIMGSLSQVLGNLELLKNELSGAPFTSNEDSDAFRQALSKLQEIRTAEEELRATIG
jgi:predicted secreted protein